MKIASVLLVITIFWSAFILPSEGYSLLSHKLSRRISIKKQQLCRPNHFFHSKNALMMMSEKEAEEKSYGNEQVQTDEENAEARAEEEGGEDGAGEQELKDEEQEQKEEEEEEDPNQDVKEEITALEEEIQKLEKELMKERETVAERGKNGYYTLAVEVENFKKSTNANAKSIEYRATSEVLRNVYPVMEKMNAAKDVVPATTEKGEKMHASYKGLVAQLEDISQKLGVTPFHGVVGQKYSAFYHEEVSRKPSKEFQKDTILESVEEGLEVKGYVIRKAKCIISDDVIDTIDDSSSEEEESSISDAEEEIDESQEEPEAQEAS